MLKIDDEFKIYGFLNEFQELALIRFDELR